MTAPTLHPRPRPDRLSARAIWRETPEATPREVLVTLGERTLMFTDAADRPLGHWARAGIRAVGAAGGATRYAILADQEETLEIHDQAMRAALDAGARSFPPAQGAAAPRPARRPPWTALLLLVAAGAAAAKGPGLIEAQAARMAPPAQATEFGDRMLGALLADHGPLCAAPEGAAALDAFAAATAPEARLRVLDLGGGTLTAALPGPIVLIDGAALARASDPAELAGWIAQALGPDPGAGQVRALMASVGLLADLRYVFTGTLSDGSLARAAAQALSPPARPEASPPAPAAAAFPAADWQRLRAICGDA
ncbi:MAG: hypothetical protein DI556_12535 [Rhodovulum sulfidophilum]|uniref:Uncharacterized protein n=1 Tax=Rhodovulum sulfidophilum TaxID=35806 RepID=A0A2W5Q2H8_RHOSU|nr:MAG: hypothetical protein DI556_12535 [Rhodovulum sulfidophilum]